MECSFSRTARKNQETLKTNQHGTAQSDADRLRTLIVQAEQVRRRAMESRRRRNRGNGSFVWLTRQALARRASLMRSKHHHPSFVSGNLCDEAQMIAVKIVKLPELLPTRRHARNIHIRSPRWIANPGPRVPEDFCRGRGKSTRVALTSTCSEIFSVMNGN
jgi:hypothetical protein